MPSRQRYLGGWTGRAWQFVGAEAHCCTSRC